MRPLVRVAVRCKKKNGQFGVGVLLSSLSEQDVQELTGCANALLAYVYFYDARSGGVETSLREDKHSLGLTRRNKKSFFGQEMLLRLGALAHNVLVWARRWLWPAGICLRAACWGALA